ncbi:MAG: type II toxin-antitoxin system HicB family antitoxin [Xanthomonadaceae bacterium]|nr:type II toxin-antitoxin system HicB family antitoxin [Xanthomonadaceae bacterium]MDP2186303.1 type II toxin-antitoxin system HicB family antitoxin [Xanthomonadales bacterium]MDZ4115804.1 type II toxin-antitoxin system HicB family antitoxin [Xanthomonadaceae bacterium]MDZ4379222.1 type II toxin-antitoxin system HicB family antitoxin [Xanthomonadaceae bacterium]
MKIVYWRGEHYWLGRLLDRPEIMSQGETVAELEENLRDALALLSLST